MDPVKAKDVKKSDIKILVVDDRADNLLSIETILEKDKYEIVKANSGRAALSALPEHSGSSDIISLGKSGSGK